MNNFQTILVAVFLAFFVFAVLIFSGILKIGEDTSNNNGPIGKVVVWGTFNNTPDMNKVFEDLNGANDELNISYEKKSRDTYEQDLIEAFAKGTGPDLFIISPDMIARFSTFINEIPYTNYPRKTFTDLFIDGASIYLGEKGVMGFPIAVDSMVLYYNKDMFSNEGIVSPPEYWDQLFSLSTKLIKKKDDGTILQGMIGLGRYDNITNAKDILATFLLQSNNSIVERGSNGYVSVLNANEASLDTSTAEQIMEFFIGFSNPSKDVYTWNRALPESIDMFTGSKLAMYLGHASELFKIESVNPNLSFDVTQILQTRGTNTKRTYGTIYAVAVNKKSANPAGAFGVAGLMSAGDVAKNIGVALSLPPASRALLSSKPADPYLFTFFNSAIISRAWPDPDSKGSDAIFSELLQNILSNKLSVEDAINKAHGELGTLIKK